MNTRILHTQHVALPNGGRRRPCKVRLTHKQFLALHPEASHAKRTGTDVTERWHNILECMVPHCK